MRRRLVLGSLLACLCFVLGGCGDSGGAVDKGPEAPMLKPDPNAKGKAPVKADRDTN